MQDKGWISLHRQIQDNWLYKKQRKFSEFEAWIDILLSVNHERAKVVIQHEILYCERGQSLYSLDTWGKRWKWDKSKVRRFLNLLKKEHMIETENERKTTRITVCNYDTYQISKNTDETQVKRKRNANETRLTPNNNDNKVNTIVLTDRARKFKEALYPFVKTESNPSGKYSKEMVSKFYDYWSEPNRSNTKMKFELQNTFEISRRLSNWNSNNFQKSNSINYTTGLTGN